MDIGKEIIDYLSENPAVEKQKLIIDLQNRHGERGRSDRNINRYLSKLTRNEIIKKIETKKEFKKWSNQKWDGKKSHLILNSIIETKDRLDYVFESFKTGDIIDKNVALKHLYINRKRYVLNPYQLDVIVENLETEDTTLVDHILEIIYFYINKKEIIPKNEIKFLTILKLLLRQHYEPDKSHPKLREYIIHFLGYYEDEAVIEQLKKDAENLEDLNSIKNEYLSKHTSKIISNSDKELFNLERKLRRKGKEESAGVISEILYFALYNQGLNEDQNYEPEKIRNW